MGRQGGSMGEPDDLTQEDQTDKCYNTSPKRD